VRQVYGFISETLAGTLAREAAEESQAVIKLTKCLGYQHVKGDEKFARVRCAALLDRLLPIAQDPATRWRYRRLWVPPALVNELLGWGKSGSQQVASAVSAANTMGVSWDGTPMKDADSGMRW